jgi:hypothetical protein
MSFQNTQAPFMKKGMPGITVAEVEGGCVVLFQVSNTGYRINTAISNWVNVPDDSPRFGR